MRRNIYVITSLLIVITFAQSQWSEQTSGITTALNSINAVNNNVVWTCGASGIVLRTTNGGTTWTSVTSPNSTLPLYTIWGISSDTAVVSGSSSTAYVYKTVNGGSTWTQVFSQTGGFIDAVSGGDPPQQLHIVGDPVGGRWSIWRSTDAGSSWDSAGQGYIPQAGSETGWNNSLSRAGAGIVRGAYFGTSNTRIYYIDSTGTNYARTTTGLVNSYAVWFNATNSGMTGGTILLYTTNTGINWTTLTAPGTGNILGITGSGNNWWYVRGTAIYFSSNNGSNWSTDYTAPAGTNNHITMSRSGTYMWAVRSNGGIAFSQGPIGIKPISTRIPANYSLNQNFPNPFNPSTNIIFDIPKSSFTKLIVYDVLGKEVTNLVNELLKPGSYEISFDASNYSSGIYLYKIQSGDYSQTKRMVLIK